MMTGTANQSAGPSLETKRGV